MLCSVNCDDYFEWHGFVRQPQDGGEDPSLGQQQLLSCLPQQQRQRNAAGNISNKRSHCSSLLDLYADPIDVCGEGEDYCCIQPPSIVPTRMRQPLSERSNLPPPLPLGRCSRKAAPSIKLRSVSLSPLRTGTASKPMDVKGKKSGKYIE
jgi:hypothetical protein